MRTPTRERRILNLLQQRGEVSVADLCTDLTVSEATVRRDLHALARRGLLKRLHGGATLDGVSVLEPQFQDKQETNHEVKEAIAAAALALIDDGDDIYLDGGSTVLALARQLHRKRHLTIVTNSLMAAATLMDTEHRLILVGGEFRPRSRVMIGPLTTPIISALRVRKAFMGTIGLTVEDGMTTTDPGEAYTKEQIMQRSQRVILLADHGKFGVASFARSGSLEDIHTIVTDEIDPDWQHELDQHDIHLIIAQPA